MDRGNNHVASRSQRWHFLLPGLFGCLLLGIFLTPAPLYQGSVGSVVSSKEEAEDIWLRGKHSQHSRDTTPIMDLVVANQRNDTKGLLRYFAEAHIKGQLSAEAFKEVEHLLLLEQQHHQPQRSRINADKPYESGAASLSNMTQSPHALVQEEIYWRGRDRREAELTRIHHNYSAIKPFNSWGPIYIWDWFNPDHLCPTMERVGRVGDGGKWMCGLETLRKRPEEVGRPCIVYAFGINDDTSFEEELVNITHCQVFAFDPTVKNLPASALNATPPLHFYKQALGPRDAPSRNFLIERNLLSIMKELGHTYIDVLKVDVEGAEWASFAPVFAAGPLPVGQLLIELHYQDVATTFDFFDQLEKQGFRAFSRETNYHPCVTGKMPVAIEYSFIQPATFPKGDALQASKAMLAGLPTYQRQNGVIYLLTQRTRVHSHLIAMLKGLDKYFNAAPGRSYPIVIFHDDFTPADEAAVRAATSSPLTFHRIEFDIPAFLDKEKIPERTECSKHSSTVGYRHMCRFLGLQVQHLLKHFEWHWRLDDDSLFLSPIGYDPFTLMLQNGKKYGFNRILHDNENCVVGLWDVAKDFAKDRGISPTFLDNWDDGVTFYNNFEISHRSIWTNPVVMDFMEHVDRLGGIYYVRWGDAPIRSLAVALVVPETEVHYFSDIGYAHLPYHRQEPRPLPPPFAGALWYLDGASQYIRDVEENNRLDRMGALKRRRQHGVVVIFSTSERFEALKRCLASFEEKFNKHRGYHVWVWSHGLTYEQRLELRALSSSPVRIDTMERPLHLTEGGENRAATGSKGPCGPHDVNSTRLLGWEISRIIAKRYIWQWRLADNAFFTEDLIDDPFLTMVQSRATYGVAAFGTVPAMHRACVRQLVNTVTTRFAFEKKGREELLDTVESVYFDPSFEISHRALWEDPRWDSLIEIVETGGTAVSWEEKAPTPFVGHVDGAYIRSLGVALHLQGGEGGLHIFDNLHAVDLSASVMISNRSNSNKQQQEGETRRIAGHGLEVSHDSQVLGKLFRPQRLGFLDAMLGTPVSLPRNPSSVTHGATPPAAAVVTNTPEMVWMLGETRIGHMNNTKPEAAFVLDDAVALLSPANKIIDYFWRHRENQGMPASILNDGTLGSDQTLLPTAGLAVVPERHPDQVRLILLCQRQNVSASYIEGERTQLGSAVVVVTNAQMPPSRWVYDVRQFPGTDKWNGWHTAMALTDGSLVSRNPTTDSVYIMGEQTTNVTTENSWYLKREHVVSKVPLVSLMRMSVEKMEIFATAAAVGAADEEVRNEGQWVSYAETVLETGSPAEAAERLRNHSKTLLPSEEGQAKALVMERVGLGYLSGPKLWFMGDILLDDDNGEEEGKRLVVKTSPAITGPWEDHTVMRLPSEYSTRQYICPSLYVLPDMAQDQQWEVALGLACLVRGHGATPVQEGRSQLSAQVGPTTVDVFRVRFKAPAEAVIDPIPTV
ncbi:hypothetical protein VYU27_003080 [Nannochloropsis oceanica]